MLLLHPKNCQYDIIQKALNELYLKGKLGGNDMRVDLHRLSNTSRDL